MISRLAPKKEVGVYIDNLMKALASIPPSLSDEEWGELFQALAKACPPSVVQKLCAPQYFAIWEAGRIPCDAQSLLPAHSGLAHH